MKSGQVLKMIIKDKGKKQKWLANKMNIPLSTMSNLLSKDVPFSKIVEICNLLDMPLSAFYKIYKSKLDCSEN